MKTSIHVSLQDDETSVKCHWHIPESHFLEDWGDGRAFDGTITILQPLILPLYDSHSHLQVLDAMFDPPGRASYEMVRDVLASKSGAADFEQWWRKAVHDGLIAGRLCRRIKPNKSQAGRNRFRPRPLRLAWN